jgi:hypothetical protein
MARHVRSLLLSLAAVIGAVWSIGDVWAAPVSGRYGPLLLSVRDGQVNAVFSEWRVGNGTVDAPQFSCLFLIKGRLTGSQAAIDTWFPGDGEHIRGTLDLGSKPGIQLSENHGGCSMTSGDMVAAPYTLDLDQAQPRWIGAGIVTRPRVFLRRKPADQARRSGPYLVEFDSFAVIDQRGAWLYIAYVDADGPPVTGWVRKDEVGSTVGRS